MAIRSTDLFSGSFPTGCCSLSLWTSHFRAVKTTTSQWSCCETTFKGSGPKENYDSSPLTQWGFLRQSAWCQVCRGVWGRTATGWDGVKPWPHAGSFIHNHSQNCQSYWPYPLSEWDRVFLWKSLLGYFPPAPFTFIRAYKVFIKPPTGTLRFSYIYIMGHDWDTLRFLSISLDFFNLVIDLWNKNTSSSRGGGSCHLGPPKCLETDGNIVEVCVLSWGYPPSSGPWHIGNPWGSSKDPQDVSGPEWIEISGGIPSRHHGFPNENYRILDDLGYPHFRKPPLYLNNM